MKSLNVHNFSFRVISSIKKFSRDSKGESFCLIFDSEFKAWNIEVITEKIKRDIILIKILFIDKKDIFQ